MNLVKDKSILHLVDRLGLNDKKWILADHWEADLFAIGIASEENPRRLAYVTTHNKEPGAYDCECGILSEEEEFPYVTSGRYENIGFDELLYALERHLNAKDGNE